MQAVGIKTALACILFGFSSLGPGGHFHADEGVSLRRDAGGHFATEFPALSESETKNLAFIAAKGYPHALVQLTATALQHGMTDATTQVRALFKETGIHNYETQENGPEAKVYIKTVIVTFRRSIETQSSVYRSGSRGDCRLWFGSEIYPLTSADDIYAIVVREQLLYIFNITKLDISSFIRSSLPNPIKSFFKQESVNK